MKGIVVDDGGVLREGSAIGFPNFIQSANVEHPSARTDFDLLYSSGAQGLILVGGKDAGGALHDVWFRRIGSDWRQIGAQSYETLLDATVSSVDGSLWLLDQKADGTIRLQWIDIATGAESSVGEWGPSGTYTSLYLALDRDGVPVLVASSSTSTRVGRLGLDGAGKAFASQIAPNLPLVAMRPVVDPAGYAFIREASDGSFATERRTNLEFGTMGSYDVKDVFP